METQIKTIKSVIPNLIKQFGDFLQVDVTIKLFGVKVFSFTWPPKNEKNFVDWPKKNENNYVESLNDD